MLDQQNFTKELSLSKIFHLLILASLADSVNKRRDVNSKGKSVFLKCLSQRIVGFFFPDLSKIFVWNKTRVAVVTEKIPAVLGNILALLKATQLGTEARKHHGGRSDALLGCSLFLSGLLIQEYVNEYTHVFMQLVCGFVWVSAGIHLPLTQIFTQTLSLPL